jgi:acyl-CoA synthetase (AMP-forming)/AMP-acid ligase II
MSLRRIILWKGHHDQAFARAFAETWEQDGQLLIVCPPVLRDLSFLLQLPPAPVFFAGDWEEEFRGLTLTAGTGGSSGTAGYPAMPVLGVFTTGTTRDLPKLILYTRDNIASCQRAIFALFDTSRIRTVFSYPQPYYVFGLTLGYATAHINGWNLVAPAGKYTTDHHRQWLACGDERMLTLATPAHLSDLAQYCRQSGAQPRPTYTCILGGARVERGAWLTARDELAIAAPSIGYGCAEASPGISHLAPGVEPVTGGEIGRPLPHLHVSVLAEGGIRFSGPSLCLATIEDGVIHFPTDMLVRDRVNVQPDGSMVFAARTDMVLNRGGEKFSLEHIEVALKEQLGLDSICVAVPDQRLGQELGVIIGRRPGVTRDQVFALLEQVFGRKFDLSRYRELDQIPLNDNSKPDRKSAALALH